MTNIKFWDWEAEQMKDPEFAREYLKIAQFYQRERRRIKRRIKAKDRILSLKEIRKSARKKRFTIQEYGIRTGIGFIVSVHDDGFLIIEEKQ